MKRQLTIILSIVLALAACSTDREPGELFAPDNVGAIVVDATMIVGDLFPVMLLTRTLSPDAPFSSGAAAISGATVVIRTGVTEVTYEERSPGIYGPPISAPRVLPSTTYRLEIETGAGEVVTASTTTPAEFSVREWALLTSDGAGLIRDLATFEEYGAGVYQRPENQLVYQQGLLEARFDRGDEVGFQIGVSSLDDGSDFVIDPDFFDEEDFEDLDRDVASPPFDALDGKIRLPWFAIYFEGRYQVRFYSVDRNWYDLARTLPEFAGGGQGFGGPAGDDFERPLFRLDGAIGLFGSAAVDSIGFTILPAD